MLHILVPHTCTDKYISGVRQFMLWYQHTTYKCTIVKNIVKVTSTPGYSKFRRSHKNKRDKNKVPAERLRKCASSDC